MMGQRMLPTVGPDGGVRMKCSQVAEVAVPLTSIGELCDDEQVVAFGKHGWVIWGSRTNQSVHHPRTNGIYCLEEWIPPADTGAASGFPRQA